MSDDDRDDDVCEGYPEHEWEFFDERDGIRTDMCRRCGAETWWEVDPQ